ncbi:MAG TPA: hypothetical protein VMV18_01395 [bacterium]|nr:hypothetical protein [bacterium]
MKTVAASLLLIAALLPASPAFAKGGTRLHVDVDDKDGETVNISVPLSLATATLAAAGKSTVEISANDADLKKMRDAWAELRRSGEKASITTHDKDEDVVIEAEGDLVRIEVTRAGAKTPNIRIRLPSDAVDALLSTNGDELDVAGALKKMAAAPKGNLIDVNDDGDHVRIWFE